MVGGVDPGSQLVLFFNFWLLCFVCAIFYFALFKFLLVPKREYLGYRKPKDVFVINTRYFSKRVPFRSEESITVGIMVHDNFSI